MNGKFDEPSPVISPWNSHQNGRPGSTSSNASSAGSTSSSAGDGSPLHHQPEHPNQLSWPHPFAQRAELHYAQRQQNRFGSSGPNDVSITCSRSGGGGVTLSPSVLSASNELNLFPQQQLQQRCDSNKRFGRFVRSESVDTAILRAEQYQQQQQQQHQSRAKKFSCDSNYAINQRHLDESFRKIIAKADHSITQAESILSSLRVEGNPIRPQPEGAKTEDESSSEPASLGSDIETNIRRLEKTQAKINAALEGFRNVQTQQQENKFASLPRPQTTLTRTPQSFPQQLNVKAQTAPAKMESSRPKLDVRHSHDGKKSV